MTSKLRLAALMVVLMGLLAGPTTAQEAPAEAAQEVQQATEAPPAQQPGTEAEEQQKFAGEITITARKQQETLDTVPLTVRAFTAEDMQELRIESTQDIADLTPGLVIANYIGYRADAGLKFRGMDVGTEARTAQGASAYLDGIYLPGSSLFLPMESLERTEVIKGPQSAFYGRSSFGGAINLITRQPSAEWQGDFAGIAGSNERLELNAGVGGPLSETWSFRAFGRYYDYGGGWDNPVAGSETLGAQNSLDGSLALRFQPSDRSSFTLRTLYAQDDDGAGATIFWPSSILNCGPFSQDGQTGTSRYFCGELSPDIARPVGFDTSVVDVAGSNWPKDDFGLERDFLFTSFDFDISLGDGNTTLSSNTGYLVEETILVDDFTGSGRMLWWYENKDTLISQELRINGGSSRLDWLVGAYYLDAEYEDLGNGFGCGDPNARIFGFAPFCSTILGVANVRGAFADVTSPPKTIENMALFGSVTWRASSRVSLAAEGRLARESISEGSIENIVDGSEVLLEGDFDSFSPRGILEWQATEYGMMYASVALGNKSGDFNDDFARDVAPPCRDAFSQEYGFGLEVPEEKLLNYELGWKQSFKRGLHRFAAAGYFMDWTDQQYRGFVNLVDTNCDGVVDENDEFQVDYLASAGKSEIMGAELYYSGWLSSAFNLSLSYNYNKTEYLEFFDDSYGRVFGSRDASGKEMPRSPNHAATLGLMLRLPVTDRWDFMARADAVYSGSAWAWAHNLAETGDSLRANFRTGIESDHWVFTAWVENLTDEDTVLSTRRFTDFSNLSTGFWGGLPRPREYGVTVRYKFF